MHIPLRRYITLLAIYLKPQWRSTLLLALSLLASITLQLLNPQILRFFIDTAIKSGATSTLVDAGLLFTGIALANQGIAILNAYLSTNVAWTATNQLRSDLVAHCLSLDMSFHKMRTTGEMIERIDGDVNTLANFFSQLIVNLLTSAILLVAILTIFFLIDWREGITMTLFTIVAFSILLHMRHRAVPLWQKMRQINTTFYGFLSERLTGTEDIRANGATAYILRRFYLLLREWFPIYRKAEMAGQSMGIISLFLFVCGTAIALSIGTYLWMQGLITIGVVYTLYSYTDQLSQPIQQIQTQLQDLQQAEACMQRIEELLALKSALPAGIQPFQPYGALTVECQHMTFGYVADEPVLHDISFKLAPGRVLGILGRTGSGKTTLSRLLFRLYDPQAGEIRLNDTPIQSMNVQDLRSRIGMVTQDVQLFHASLRDNLTFFNRAISDQYILEALEDVGLSAWYQSLPEGLATVIGATGEGLSAGEAQLLALARVFLRNPGLVILDEASSRLDPATEKKVEQAVSKLFTNRTALIIAHRLATIQRADDILIIEDGCVLEYGTRDQLINDPGSHFSRLLFTASEMASVASHKDSIERL